MPEDNVGGTDRLVRAVVAVVGTVVAVRALASGRRKTGLVAGLAALGAGFNVTTQFCGLNALLGVDTTEE
ncbi:YgaP-like transmembrane domain [Halobaculum sp. MBLA0143]|uniref:YgaP-like transmembrane domain n=1 Tax=Halobaculum sp. MBLA0143 TaxID=3079933 RepID=UPI00352656D2